MTTPEPTPTADTAAQSRWHWWNGRNESTTNAPVYATHIKHPQHGHQPVPTRKEKTMGDEEGFEPDDLNELETTFAKIYKDSATGYTIELHLSKLAAQEMIDEWLVALMGDKDSIRQCMINYSYIMEEIITQIDNDHKRD